ncbi:MAG: protein kinase [Myxococcota bacterium]
MSDATFPHTLTRNESRYTGLQEVGAGNMGVVYRAFDRIRGRDVALKTLRSLDPQALIRLKSEFRSTAEITHHNLVRFYELVSIEGHWFVVMEFVQGVNLRSMLLTPRRSRSHETAMLTSETLPLRVHASATGPLPNFNTFHRGDVPVTPPSQSSNSTFHDLVGSDFSVEHVPSGARVLSSSAPRRRRYDPLSPEKVQDIFGQLAEGISALHRMGKLHCDIKPGNTMIDPQGRVVLLDFGLIRDQAHDVKRHRRTAGTPAYISPEQLKGRAASPASDWYSFGVMLYEALCGGLPFWGTVAQIVHSKVHSPPPPVEAIPAMPQEIVALCTRLLRRDPADRPSGEDVLAVFGRRPTRLVTPLSRPDVFIGRAAQLTALTAAWSQTRGGAATVARLHGVSGLGKSAIAERFLSEVAQDSDAIVLIGRCHERESVPYKAFDGLLDALTQVLIDRKLTLDPLPQDVDALLQIFPALRQVKGFDASTRAPLRDQQEQRRRAFHALKALLTGISAQHPLMLMIDDAQWGNRDSGRMLYALLSSEPPPSMMLLLSYRSDEASQSPFLQELSRAEAQAGDALHIVDVEVAPLDDAVSKEMAARLIGVDEADPRVQIIAEEAGGSPFFIGELARHVRDGGAAEVPQLDQVVLHRVAALEPMTRRLLEAVVVAGRPVPQDVVIAASGATSPQEDAVHMLRLQRLARTFGDQADAPIESYHDRIREILVGEMEPARLRMLHMGLADAYVEQVEPDPQVVAGHYYAGGARARAGGWALQAAEQAVAALAFDAAAQFYAMAAECQPEQPQHIVEEARALVNAGRLAEAAPRYLDAAKRLPDEGRTLRRLAAKQYLMSGYIQDGLQVLKPLLNEAKLPYPSSPGWALAWVLGRNVMLDVRGVKFTPRPRAEMPPEQLEALELCWTAGSGLGSIDVMRGAYFLIRGTSIALRIGDAERVAQGLGSMGMSVISRAQSWELEKGRRYLKEAARIGEESGDPRIIGTVKIYTGTARMSAGQWMDAKIILEEGIDILESACTGVAAELSLGRTVMGNTLQAMGRYQELRRRCSEWLRRADEVGDLYGAVWLRLHLCNVLLADDQGADAREQANAAVKSMNAPLFTPQHLLGAVLASQAERYLGHPQSAYDRMQKIWKTAERSFAMGWQANQMNSRFARASAALQIAAARPERRKKFVNRADRDASLIARVELDYAQGYAGLLRAGVAHLNRQPADALRRLQDAEVAFTRCDMSGYVAVTQIRRGQLIGGDEGRALRDEGRSALRAEGIRSTEKWMATFSPGFDVLS